MAKLTLIGAGDIALLGGIFLTAMLKTSLPKSLTVLSLCFPFLLAGSGCLFMLGHLPPRNFFAGSLAFLLLPAPCVLFLQPSFHAAGVWRLLGANGAGKTTLMRMIAAYVVEIPLFAGLTVYSYSRYRMR